MRIWNVVQGEGGIINYQLLVINGVKGLNGQLIAGESPAG